MISARLSGAARHDPASASPARRLLGYDRQARGWLLGSVIAAVTATLALVAQLALLAVVVNGVFLEGQGLPEVLPLLGAALALLLLRALLGSIGELLSRQAAHRLTGTLRADLTAQLLHLGPTWSTHERSGEVGSVLTSGLESIEEYITRFLPARWLATVVPVLVLLIVLLLDPPSVLVLLFTGPLLLLLLAVIGGRTRAVTARRFLEMRTLSAFFLDILRGIGTLKLFGRSREQADNLRRISDRYGDTTMDVLRTAFQTSLVLEWGATIAIALVAVEIGLRLLDAGIAFERALAVLLIVPEFFLPLRQLSIRYHVGTAGVAAITRVFEILDVPAPVTSGAPGRAAEPHAAAPPALRTPPTVRLHDIGVTYPGRDAPALERLTLELAAGTTTALVGATGAGKSTVANVLLRFIEPERGTVEVDGQRLAAIGPREWRASVAWVPQRPYLFQGSVADNIRLAHPAASDAEVRAAAEAAAATGFIERMGAGFETAVGERGARLSGGQRQRIAIARAFLRDAPLLILDEATSYQDEASEAAIAGALERLMAGRTVLVIAHRLRLAQRADQVAVLDAGRVVEAGSPADLLAEGRAYRRLLEQHDRGEAAS